MDGFVKHASGAPESMETGDRQEMAVAVEYPDGTRSVSKFTCR
jgi:hypothetical protein